MKQFFDENAFYDSNSAIEQSEWLKAYSKSQQIIQNFCIRKSLNLDGLYFANLIRMKAVGKEQFQIRTNRSTIIIPIPPRRGR